MKRWFVAAGCSIGLAVGFGPIFVYSFGLFQKPMIAELGWNRAQFSLGFSLATLLTALLNPAVGALIDRGGVRPVALTGVILLPLVLLAYSVVGNYAAFMLVALGMGLVGATTSYPTYIPALPPLFQTRLGLAFSIAAAGVGYGAGLWGIVISAFIRDLGWRHAFQALAAVVLAIGLLNVILLIRDKPRVQRAAAEQTAHLAESGRLFRSALKSGLFWRLIVGFGLVPVVNVGINFHLPAMLSDRGFSSQQVAGVLAVQGVALLIGRVGTGALLDYLPTRLVALGLFGGQLAAVMVLMAGVGGPAPYVAAALLGLSNGGEGDLMPFVLARRFGAPAYGKIYGAAFTVFNIGTLLGPIAMGTGFEVFGSYTLVLGGLLALSVISAGLVIGSAGGRNAASAPAAPVGA